MRICAYSHVFLLFGRKKGIDNFNDLCILGCMNNRYKVLFYIFHRSIVGADFKSTIEIESISLRTAERKAVALFTKAFDIDTYWCRIISIDEI